MWSVGLQPKARPNCCCARTFFVSLQGSSVRPDIATELLRWKLATHHHQHSGNVGWFINLRYTYDPKHISDCGERMLWGETERADS